MKNFKNILSAAALLVVLGFGSVSANAGLLISDRSSNQACTDKNSLLNQLAGIFVVGMPSLDGIIIVDRVNCPAGETDGIILTDRNGIIIVD